MDLLLVYDLHIFIEMKERGSFQTYAELDRLYTLSQLDVYNNYLDKYAVTGKIHNALEPFKKKLTFNTVTSPNGLITLPNDYQMALPSCYTTPNYGKIRFYNESEWLGAVKSQLRPATTTKPAAKIIDGKIELFPAQSTAGVIEYLATPIAPIFVYTQTGRAINYNQAGSTQLKWLDIYIPKLIMGALSYQGINLNEESITSYAEMKSKETV